MCKNFYRLYERTSGWPTGDETHAMHFQLLNILLYNLFVSMSYFFSFTFILSFHNPFIPLSFPLFPFSPFPTLLHPFFTSLFLPPHFFPSFYTPPPLSFSRLISLISYISFLLSDPITSLFLQFALPDLLFFLFSICCARQHFFPFPFPFPFPFNFNFFKIHDLLKLFKQIDKIN